MFVNSTSQKEVEQDIDSFIKDQHTQGDRNRLSAKLKGVKICDTDREKRLLKVIQQDLHILERIDVSGIPGELDIKWKKLTTSEPNRFLNEDCSPKADVLRNFRKLSIFIPDVPTCDLSGTNPINIVSGGRRGARKLLCENLEMLKDRKCLDLLKKYPVSRIGNPNVFIKEGYEYTHRWTKHIYSLSLFKKYLESELTNDFVLLDLGSSYGIFSFLIKKEYPKTTHILVDFPEQLTLAHYFLGMSFPEAKIATVSDLKDIAALTNNTISEYDFLLVPWFYYDKLRSIKIDVYANFASLGEMRREWFDFYLSHPVFKSAKCLFMMNSFMSGQVYDNDLTFLDYPFRDFDQLYLGIWPYSHYTYDKKQFFFYEKVCFASQYFEYIGKRK